MSARDGYVNTLIVPAGDCPAVAAEAPPERDGVLTVAALHYALLAPVPYALTQEDVLFRTWLARQGLPDSADTEALRAQFFAKPQACLRGSPLGKRYGWAIHFDEHGRAALVEPGSARFAELSADPAVTVRAALRSKR